MKNSLAILLLLGFIAFSVLGVFEVHAGMQNHDNECVAATIQGVDCPQQETALGFLSFHFETYKSFLTAVFNSVTFSFFILFSILSLLFFFIIQNRPRPFIHFQHGGSYKAYLGGTTLQYKLSHWLCLFLNSPSAY